MEYLHIKNLEKYHPGYKDRNLLWAKIHIRMIQGDPDCEMITDEIDWARLIKFILLELNAQKPIPLDQFYLQRKGFNLKKRPISLTLKMLHNFIEITSISDTECIQNVTQSRVDKIRVYKEDKEKEIDKIIEDFNTVFGSNYKTKNKVTCVLVAARLNEGFTIEDFKAVHRKMLKTWGADQKMYKYLRPQTLYSPKFESYLNMREFTTKLTETGIRAYLVGQAWLKKSEGLDNAGQK